MADRPDPDRVEDEAGKRQQERADTVDEMLGEQKYPVTSEELAAEYANEPIELPNETESLGSVFDRLTDERYETAEEAREAVYGEITGPAAGSEEYNEERDLDELDESAQDNVTESGSSDM